MSARVILLIGAGAGASVVVGCATSPRCATDESVVPQTLDMCEVSGPLYVAAETRSPDSIGLLIAIERSDIAAAPGGGLVVMTALGGNLWTLPIEEFDGEHCATLPAPVAECPLQPGYPYPYDVTFEIVSTATLDPVNETEFPAVTVSVGSDGGYAEVLLWPTYSLRLLLGHSVIP